MNLPTNQKRSQCEPILCSCCRQFYASESFEGLCSTCFKKNSQGKMQEKMIHKISEITSENDYKQEIKVKQIPKQQKPENQVQKDKTRCYLCRKKVGHLGIQCKCSYIYCNMHRLPEQHSCFINFQEIAKQKLQKQIIKVEKGKITQI